MGGVSSESPRACCESGGVAAAEEDVWATRDGLEIGSEPAGGSRRRTRSKSRRKSIISTDLDLTRVLMFCNKRYPSKGRGECLFNTELCEDTNSTIHTRGRERVQNIQHSLHDVGLVPGARVCRKKTRAGLLSNVRGGGVSVRTASECG